MVLSSKLAKDLETTIYKAKKNSPGTLPTGLSNKWV